MSLSTALHNFLVQNQSVNVNIEGCGWLVGTVVAILTTVKYVCIAFFVYFYYLIVDCVHS